MCYLQQVKFTARTIGETVKINLVISLVNNYVDVHKIHHTGIFIFIIIRMI
jgi:hypothetical protein